MPRLTVAFAAALLAACTSASTGGDTVRTLDNCGTSIADDVPAFWKKYFRCVTITRSGDDVVLASKTLPPHKSPYYAEGANYVAFDTRGGDRNQNPNSISEQAFSMTIRAKPIARGIPIGTALVNRSAGDSDDEYGGDVQGLALDGVQLFAGFAAPGDDIAEEEHTFDAYEAHPQQAGAYHYHAASPGPLEVLVAAGVATKTTPGEAEVELYGVMCDGTFVLGCTELDGSVPSGEDFDAQDGHVGDLTDAEGTTHFSGRYHTHVCRSKFGADSYAPEIQYYGNCNG